MHRSLSHWKSLATSQHVDLLLLPALGAAAPAAHQSSHAVTQPQLRNFQTQTATHMQGACNTSASTSGSAGRSSRWPLCLAAVAAAVGAWALGSSMRSSAATEEHSTPDRAQAKVRAWPQLLSLGTRQRVFFVYEKRIRDLSSLDKVFDYFSSEQRENAKYMLPADLLHALVPTYPASKLAEERAGALSGERRPHHSEARDKMRRRESKFFTKFDLDGDGLLAFPEFQLVVTLLSIPKEDIHVVFDAVDLDGNGKIDAAEFSVILHSLQSKARINGSLFKKQAVPTQHSPAGTSHPACGLLVSFFGRDQRGRVELEQFHAFLGSLHHELVKLEFQHYEPDENTRLIPGIDFARSLVVAVDVNHVEALLNTVEAHAGHLGEISISFAEFESIHQLQQTLHPVKVALEFMSKVGRPVGPQELGRIVQKFAGVQLSNQVLDIILIVFGNGKGSLDTPRFLEAMRRKGHFWARRVNLAS